MDSDDLPRPHRTIEERLERIEWLLDRLLQTEESMAANESAESVALNQAIEGLQAELADVGSVDAEVVADLEGIRGAIERVGPTTPEQVNAVTAVTSSLASLTSKLKGAGSAAAAVENPPPAAPPAEQPAPAPAETPPAPAPAETEQSLPPAPPATS